jgi:hypothetical protein
MTTVKYRGREFVANDGFLEAWLLAVVDRIDRLPARADWLTGLRDDWRDQATAGYGFGVATNLDTYADTDEHRRAVLDLCRQALAELDRAGAEVSPDDRRRSGAGGPDVVFTGALPLDPVREVGRRMIDLLALGPA